MSDTLIVDQSGDRKYYSQIPHLIDDLGLSVYAFRLYCHLKRVTGESGQSWQSAKTLAKCCNMTVHTIHDAKEELVKNRLIKITPTKSKHGGRDYHLITIIDIWKRNMNCYSREQDTHGIFKDSDSTLQDTVAASKNNSSKNAAQKSGEENEAADAEPIRSENSDEFSSLPVKQSDFTLLDENIQMLKRVTGYTPPKRLRPFLIELFNKKLGKDGLMDEGILTEIYTNWIARGWKKDNWNGILQRYFERDYYTFEQDKITAMMPKENAWKL